LHCKYFQWQKISTTSLFFARTAANRKGESDGDYQSGTDCEQFFAFDSLMRLGYGMFWIISLIFIGFVCKGCGWESNRARQKDSGN
jgi:hypothetical protein